MAISDAVARNLTTLYAALMACVEAYGFMCGRRFGSIYVVILCSTLVFLTLAATLTWDISRKATCAFPSEEHETCKGGICWHGVSSRFPASEVRFRLPRQLPLA
ncbi:hypothetical protein RJT34_08793 [Clitoria ternatea]|uniref:Uncharacterized protein n=1 Tax=Clitoria ternatea TaxID=43366 RepID=A0AAN9PV32_CLITE